MWCYGYQWQQRGGEFGERRRKGGSCTCSHHQQATGQVSIHTIMGVHIKISLLVSSEVVEGLCVCQHHFYTPIFHSNTERAPFNEQTK